MTEIRVLPEVVQNKIAAGEVVERPASVVKELVENAIDAGASEVAVEIAAGGAELIRVTDDGKGMSAADLAVAVERHATSKIRDIDDIFHIHTLGFRGEALPSIGSVSRLTIVTATPGAAEGAALTVEGGDRQPVRPAPPRRGTMVEVSNLFFNTPARRKFMKSPAAEVAAVGEVLTRLALAHPEVAFRLDNNGRRSLELAVAPDLEARVVALFGKMALLPVAHGSAQGVEISGFIAEPPESRSQSRFIYTLLNGRWFRHPGIARAVADACAGNLPPRRYPFAVLCFAIDTTKVDVNAHPAKEVVRFENEPLIVGSASNAVREALARRHFAGAPAPDGSLGVREAVADYLDAAAPALPGLGGGPAFTAGRYGPAGHDGKEGGKGGGAAHGAGGHGGARAWGGGAGGLGNAGRTGGNDGARYGRFGASAGIAARLGAGVSPHIGGADDTDDAASPAAPGAGEALATSAPAAIVPNAADAAALLAGRQWRFLGQAGGKYLVVEKPEGIMLVDQHALHERWNYERLKERPHAIVRQELLVPIEISLSPAEAAAATAALPILREAGFAAELLPAGEDGVPALRLTAHPDFVKRAGLEQVCRDVLSDERDADGPAPGEEFRERLLARLACRSAVLFGTELSEELCLDLLDRLLRDYLPTCPHGRPTTITLTWAELAGKFGR